MPRAGAAIALEGGPIFPDDESRLSRMLGERVSGEAHNSKVGIAIVSILCRHI